MSIYEVVCENEFTYDRFEYENEYDDEDEYEDDFFTEEKCENVYEHRTMIPETQVKKGKHQVLSWVQKPIDLPAKNSNFISMQEMEKFYSDKMKKTKLETKYYILNNKEKIKRDYEEKKLREKQEKEQKEREQKEREEEEKRQKEEERKQKEEEEKRQKEEEESKNRRKLMNIQSSRVCRSIEKNAKCVKGEKCVFAHTKNELVLSECYHGKKCRNIKYNENVCCNVNEEKPCKFLHPDETKDNYLLRNGINFSETEQETEQKQEKTEQETEEEGKYEPVFVKECENKWKLFCLIDLIKNNIEQTEKDREIQIQQELEKKKMEQAEIEDRQKQLAEKEQDERKHVFDKMANHKELSSMKKCTKMCISIENNQTCPHGENCRFAHSVDELSLSNCLFGEKCRFVFCENGIYKNNIKSHKICKHAHPDESRENYYQRIGIQQEKTEEKKQEKTEEKKQEKTEEKKQEKKQDKTENKYKTRFCNSFKNKEKCPHGKKCKFAHNVDELSLTDCLFGERCRFVSFVNGVYKNISETEKICTYIHPCELKDNYVKRIM